MEAQRKTTNHQNIEKNQSSQTYRQHHLIQSLKSVEEMSQQMRMSLQLSYYRTIEVIYKTQNFNHQIISANAHEINNNKGMQSQHEAIYLPQVSLIGNISQLQKTKLKCRKMAEQKDQNTQQLMKIIYPTTYDKEQKRILIKTSQYRASFTKHFNRILRVKNKNEKYIITNLLPVYYRRSKKSMKTQQQEQQDKVYFILQPTSYIVQIFEQFYNIHFKPLERILDQDFRFSNIKLTKVFTIEQLDINCKDGFMISQIKHKFQTRHQNSVGSKKENITIVGMVNIVEDPIYEQYQSNNSRNKKEMVIWVTEVLFRHEQAISQSSGQQNIIKCSEIGRCKVIIKYFQEDAQYLEKLIINNHIYVIADPQIIITDNLNIIYQLNIPKNNAKNHCIFRVSDEPYDGINFGGELFKKNYHPFSIQQVEQIFAIKLETVKVNKFLQKCINRNIAKLQVGLLQIEVIYGSIRCSKCGYEIKRNCDLDSTMQADDFETSLEKLRIEMNLNEQQLKRLVCRKMHKESHSLQLWGSVRAADDTGTCILSMQHKELIQFLELEQYYEEFQNFVTKNGKGMVLINSNRQKNKSEDDILFKIKNRLRKTYVQKSVIGYARTELDKTFRESLTEEEQLDFQVSFQNSKKYLQHKKIFPNGIIEKRTEEILLLPYIKVLQVKQPDW